MPLEDRSLRWQQYDAKIPWAGGISGLGAADTIAVGEYFFNATPVTALASLTDANDTLIAVISTATTVNLNATLTDQSDTLSASIVGTSSTTLSATVFDGNDTLTASLNVPISATANLVDAGDTLGSAANVSVSIAGNIADQADTLSASLSSAAVFAINGTLQDEFDFLSASLSVTDAPISQPKEIGDAGDILRRKKPVIMYRPKAVQQLEEAQEELEDIRPNARVSVNKKKVKAALAIVKAIEPPPSYAENIAAIETALKNVSRETAKHEGMQTALLSVIKQIQGTMAAMEAARAEQKKRNMRKILLLV